MSITGETVHRLIELRRYGEAKQAIDEGLSKEPRDTSLMYWLAHICWMEDECEEGIDVCRQILAIDPHDYDASYLLFRLLEEVNQRVEAEKIIIDLIKAKPGEVSYLAGYARLLLFGFELRKAKELCAEALHIDSTSVEARTVKVLIDITEGKYGDSETEIRTLITEFPESIHIVYLLVVQLINRKEYKVALLLSQELLRQDPANEDLVEQIVELKKLTHWAALPLWPTTKFGYPGSMAMWGLFIVLVFVGRKTNTERIAGLAFVYLGWVLYTWLYNPVISKFINMKGPLQ